MDFEKGVQKHVRNFLFPLANGTVYMMDDFVEYFDGIDYFHSFQFLIFFPYMLDFTFNQWIHHRERSEKTPCARTRGTACFFVFLPFEGTNISPKKFFFKKEEIKFLRSDFFSLFDVERIVVSFVSFPPASHSKFPFD